MAELSLQLGSSDFFLDVLVSFLFITLFLVWRNYFQGNETAKKPSDKHGLDLKEAKEELWSVEHRHTHQNKKPNLGVVGVTQTQSLQLDFLLGCNSLKHNYISY